MMTAILVRCVALVMLMVTSATVKAQPPAPAQKVGIEQRLNEKIPLDLIFRDQQGTAVSLSGYFGKKPVILVLAYFRCPRLCSLVLNGLVDGLKKIDYEIGDQFTVITVSIDPREGPGLAAAKKAAYVEQYGRRDDYVTFRTGARCRAVLGLVVGRYLCESRSASIR